MVPPKQGVRIEVGRVQRFLWIPEFVTESEGRGFAIGETCLVTCFHVVQRLWRIYNDGRIILPESDHANRLRYKAIRPQTGQDDLTFIVFNAPHKLAPMKLAAANPAVDTPIMFTNRRGQQKTGVVRSYRSDCGSRLTWMCSNLEVLRGDSGSPVCNADGEVIGLVCATEGHQSLLLPVENIRQHAEALGLL